MNDYARFHSIAEDLKEGGNHVASEAIDELLTSAISAHDAKQEAARHAKRITELEAALEMVRGIRYQEMRLHLPEGGHVSLRWPESMSLESAEMLREVFDLQMKAHAKYMANRVATPEADAARTGASTSALDAYKVAPVTLLEQQKRSIAERHFQGAPDVCRALKCIDEACAEMLTTARTGASS
ncbi:hypothetical protein PTBPS01_04005 [Burkholderia pseudomallei]|uniref:hypothetical protein n=1 Tax=Burkholderia pseudomallei TaxID=28450 RepID=UPI0007A08309|nr:hypothetical protein [Burkholderia pseudomallei]KYZ79035.1 hypothetical protein PTBPS01_04005 [Burkholderia pseudomallei]